MNDIGSALEKIRAEDSWLRSENGIAFFLHLGLPEGIHLTDLVDEKIISSTECDTVNPNYKESAALHCFLANLYQALPRELSDETKKEIELKKLKINNPRLIGCLDMSPAKIARFFSDKTIHIPGRDNRIFSVNLEAPTAYLQILTIKGYLGFNKSMRAYHHLESSLKLSGKNNQMIFKSLIEPNVLSYMALQLIGHHEGSSDCIGYPLLGWINDFYKEAKQRVKQPCLNA
jgi:hypothetical protein